MSRQANQSLSTDALAPEQGEDASVILDVRNLAIQYTTNTSVIRAVEDVSFVVRAGETVGLVGESGSGKSTVASAIVKLVVSPGEIAGGQILFEGTDLIGYSDSQMQRIRGREIGFVFQDPMSSLNPLYTIGHQIRETITLNLGLPRREADDRIADLLSKVGMARPRDIMLRYPHELSGGMQQRVMIAMALACDPKLLIADEPTSALDMTVQAQILELLQSATAERGTALLLITHSMGVAAGMCDRVVVMYAGRIVEDADTFDLFGNPAMPYTTGLLASLPQLDDEPHSRLRTIGGVPPRGARPPHQCQFAPRCNFSRDPCLTGEPDLTLRGDTGSAPHLARCWGTQADGWIERDRLVTRV